MSVNSSSFFGFLLFSSHLNCLNSRVGNFIFTAFTGTSILFLLPLYVFVLYLGHKRRRQHGSASASSCDFITYHIVVMEIIDVLSSIFYCVGVYAGLLSMIVVATNVFFTALCGQMFFLYIVCIESYLAVVHPITYLHMRNSLWARVRNSITWGIWLLCCAKMSMIVLNSLDALLIVYFAQQVLSLVVVSFCSLSLIRFFMHRGPGEGSRERERVDQSKQKAFHTVLVLTGTLLLRFGGTLVCTAIYVSPQMSTSDRCAVVFSGHFFSLPNTVAAPLLFLHRAGKLPCCKNNSESRQGST